MKPESKSVPKWHAQKGNDQGFVVETATGRTVAVSYRKEDANILAAAPALIAAADKVLQMWYDLYREESDEAERAAWRELQSIVLEAKEE